MRSRWCLLTLALLLVGAQMAIAQDPGPYGSMFDRPDRDPFADRAKVRDARPKERNKITVEERLIPTTGIAPTQDEVAPSTASLPDLGTDEYSAYPDRAAQPSTVPKPVPAIWNAEPVSESDPWEIDRSFSEYELVRTCRARDAVSPVSIDSGGNSGQSSSTAASEPAPQRGAKDSQGSRAKN